MTLTVEQIREMAAGRELDALVAERVMGWVDVCSDTRTIYGGSTWFVPHGRPDARFLRYEVIPHYSTEIAAAWLVVEKVTADGWRVEIDLEPSAGPSQCACAILSRGDRYEDFTPHCTTAFPLAICRAVLLAVHAAAGGPTP